MTALTIIIGGGKLEGRILKKMHERIIKNFMDIIILAELRNRPMSGYDVISFIHNKLRLQAQVQSTHFSIHLKETG